VLLDASVDASGCCEHPGGSDDPGQEPLERDASGAAGVD